jgi:hypothetical protein
MDSDSDSESDLIGGNEDKKNYDELIDQIDIIVVDNIKNFVCKHCKSHFKRKELIVNHLNRLNKCYDNSFTYSCSKCNKGFNILRDYHKHINRKKSCLNNVVIDMKINQVLQKKYEDESLENKYKILQNDNNTLVSKIKSLENKIISLEDDITSLNSSHDNFIKHVNLFFTEFYDFPVNHSKLFPQPYFAMIIIIKKIKNNTLEYDYLFHIVSHLSTHKEIEHFVFPLVLSHFFDINISIKLINMFVTIYDNLFNNRVHKINFKNSTSLRFQIKHIVGMIYYWIIKYKSNHEDIESLNTHFSIPQYFYTFSTDIDIGFDFNSLI